MKDDISNNNYYITTCQRRQILTNNFAVKLRKGKLKNSNQVFVFTTSTTEKRYEWVQKTEKLQIFQKKNHQKSKCSGVLLINSTQLFKVSNLIFSFKCHH
jgi:hypothetical protein